MSTLYFYLLNLAILKGRVRWVIVRLGESKHGGRVDLSCVRIKVWSNIKGTYLAKSGRYEYWNEVSIWLGVGTEDYIEMGEPYQNHFCNLVKGNGLTASFYQLHLQLLLKDNLVSLSSNIGNLMVSNLPKSSNLSAEFHPTCFQLYLLKGREDINEKSMNAFCDALWESKLGHKKENNLMIN